MRDQYTYMTPGAGQILLTADFVVKFYWNTTRLVHLHIVYSCLCAAKADVTEERFANLRVKALESNSDVLIQEF